MIALINIRSIYSNNELLIDYIIEFKPLLVVLTETWISAIDNGNIINTQLLPLRYTGIHIIRKTEWTVGDGVGIIYRYTIDLINSHDLYLTNCEYIKADFIINKLYIFNIIVMYRPSNNYITFINEFYELTSSIWLDFTLVMDDFNFHFNKSDRYITEFKKMLLTNNLIEDIQTHIYVFLIRIRKYFVFSNSSRFFKYNINNLPI